MSASGGPPPFKFPSHESAGQAALATEDPGNETDLGDDHEQFASEWLRCNAYKSQILFVHFGSSEDVIFYMIVANPYLSRAL